MSDEDTSLIHFSPTQTRSSTSLCEPSVCLISVFSGHTFVFLGTSASGCVLLGCEYFPCCLMSAKKNPGQLSRISGLGTAPRTGRWETVINPTGCSLLLLPNSVCCRMGSVQLFLKRNMSVCLCMKKNNQDCLLSSSVSCALSLSDTRTHTNWRLFFLLVTFPFSLSHSFVDLSLQFSQTKIYPVFHTYDFTSSSHYRPSPLPKYTHTHTFSDFVPSNCPNIVLFFHWNFEWISFLNRFLITIILHIHLIPEFAGLWMYSLWYMMSKTMTLQ